MVNVLEHNIRNVNTSEVSECHLLKSNALYHKLTSDFSVPVGSMSWQAFRSLQVGFSGLAHSFTSCQLLVKG